MGKKSQQTPRAIEKMDLFAEFVKAGKVDYIDYAVIAVSMEEIEEVKNFIYQLETYAVYGGNIMVPSDIEEQGIFVTRDGIDFLLKVE